MGCGASKQADGVAVERPVAAAGVNQSNNSSLQTSSQGAAKESAKGSAKESAKESAKTAATATATATASTNNDGEDEGEEGYNEGEVDIPDDDNEEREGTPSPTPLDANRHRFLSYASGASTPNTSSGDLSWDGSNPDEPHSSNNSANNANNANKKNQKSNGNKNNGKKNKNKSPINKNKGTESNNNENQNQNQNQNSNNPKTLKHSGSAIRLEEMRKDGAGLHSAVVHIEVPFGKPIEEVYDGVHDGPVLGSGVSGLVRLVTHKATGIKYAVKCLDLGMVGTKEGLAQLREEIFIMCQLDHPNIVRLEEVYESHSEIYLVQELCFGGELFDRLDEQPDYHYTEAECARLVKQMLSAVRYLHSKGIIHRDLKLENFLFSSTAQDSDLKMIDFGLSKHFRFGEVHHEAVGTPYTVAPEVIKGAYDERCDIWAIGVITFLLLSGDPPFGGCGGPEPLLTVRSNILSGTFEFEPEDIWSIVSDRAQQFIKALLVTDPQQRPTARDAQKHPWLKEWASRSGKPSDKNLSTNVVKALVAFKEFSDMRKLLCEVLSFTLLPEQIKDLRKEFEKIDTDGSGEISLAALKKVLLTNAGAGTLGALKEEEVEDIFNAMRVNKSETRIHWHEFIAAGLSQCQVDDRNLRLAFDRLDSDHKGYITLDDLMDLVGNDELHSEEMMRKMWKDSMKAVHCNQARITYDNFLLLMKGQTKEPTEVERLQSSRVLDAVPEDEEDGPTVSRLSQTTPKSATTPVTTPTAAATGRPLALLDTTEENLSMHSLPNLGEPNNHNSSASSMGLGSPGNLDAETSPAPSGRVITNIPDVTANTNQDATTPDYGRRRSYSLPDNEDSNSSADKERYSPVIQRTVKPINVNKLSETNGTATATGTTKVDHKNKSAIVVNRNLYRAHRQMRLAVLEASKQFEEQQARRARDELIAQKEAVITQAGLVMRHGHRTQVTTEAIRKLLQENKEKQQAMVQVANRRCGRGRYARKKTISDMSGMMGTPSMGQDEMGDIAAKAGATAETPTAERLIFMGHNSSIGDLGMPELSAVSSGGFLDRKDSLNGSKRASTACILKPPSPSATTVMPTTTAMTTAAAAAAAASQPKVDTATPNLRGATVPGEFRKTADPFSADGMYGGSRLTTKTINVITASD